MFANEPNPIVNEFRINVTFPSCSSIEMAGKPTGSATLKIMPCISDVRNSNRSSRYFPTWNTRSAEKATFE